jgi:mono/diheme cytochrome c family protein
LPQGNGGVACDKLPHETGEPIVVLWCEAMRSTVWFLLGLLASPIIIIIVASLVLLSSPGFGALDPPTRVEKWLAQLVRTMAISQSAKRMRNPVADSEEALAAARAHWADHCEPCHANDGSGDTELGKHLYPPAPDMREPATQSKSDGELFFIIQNGVCMTGMPGWGTGGHDEDSWKLVRFIRRLPDLSPQEELEMRRLNPKSPEEMREEQEERDFLEGGAIHEPEPAHHH